jgi:uncharacterized protein (TIGR00730 family)
MNNTTNNNQSSSETTIEQYEIDKEFNEATTVLKDILPAVTLFGSARTSESDKYYQLAERISFKFSELGFSVISGGGPGIMEASNKGAFRGKSDSIGLNIRLPKEQKPNNFQNIKISFNYFFTRKLMFIKFASAFVVFPGGYGTLDELLQVLTLIQTKKINQVPIILVGSEFWNGLIGWLEQAVLSKKMINQEDLNLIKIMDDESSIVNYVKAFYQCDGNEVCILQNIP